MGQTGQFELLSGEVQVFARDLGEEVEETEVCQPQVCRSNRVKISSSCRRSQQRNNVHRCWRPLHITPIQTGRHF